jgi:hypothetical protein
LFLEIGLDEAKKTLDRWRAQKLLVSSEEYLNSIREHDEAWARHEEELKKKKILISGMLIPLGQKCLWLNRDSQLSVFVIRWEDLLL